MGLVRQPRPRSPKLPPPRPRKSRAHRRPTPAHSLPRGDLPRSPDRARAAHPARPERHGGHRGSPPYQPPVHLGRGHRARSRRCAKHPRLRRIQPRRWSRPLLHRPRHPPDPHRNHAMMTTQTHAIKLCALLAFAAIAYGCKTAESVPTPEVAVQAEPAERKPLTQFVTADTVLSPQAQAAIEIGRASCRERGKQSVDAVALNKKESE